MPISSVIFLPNIFRKIRKHRETLLQTLGRIGMWHSLIWYCHPEILSTFYLLIKKSVTIMSSSEDARGSFILKDLKKIADKGTEVLVPQTFLDSIIEQLMVNL